jgi:hypothetical protein
MKNNKTSSNSKTNKDNKAKGSKIIVYRNDIYDCSLVVANQHATLEELKSKYIFYDGVELDADILNGEASTSRCIDTETNEAVVLVKYNHASRNKNRDKQLNFINMISHEATHVALDIYELCAQNVCFCSPEPFCYLQGWACECIYKTLKK